MALAKAEGKGASKSKKENSFRRLLQNLMRAIKNSKCQRFSLPDFMRS